MSKSILTMSAAQRLRAQEKQSRKFDHAVNKKFKQMKKAWKKKIAGKVIKGMGSGEEKMAAKKSAAADAVKIGADLGAGAADMDGAAAAAAANEAGEKVTETVDAETDQDESVKAAAAAAEAEEAIETKEADLADSTEE